MTVKSEALARIKKKALPFEEHNIARLMEVGSGAHGTKLDPSNPHFIDDTDILGVIIPPKEAVLGLHQWAHSVWADDDGFDFSLMEWGKFIRLLLKSNPNVLLTLWMEKPILDSEPFRELVMHRSAFASKEAYGAFAGYAFSQIKKMTHLAYAGYMGTKRKSLVDKYGYDCKNAAHAIRLYRMGVEFLRTGEMIVNRPDAEELKHIKSGGWSMGEVERCAMSLEKEAKDALAQSPLPEAPDKKRAEEILLAGYDFMWAYDKKFIRMPSLYGLKSPDLDELISRTNRELARQIHYPY